MVETVAKRLLLPAFGKTFKDLEAMHGKEPRVQVQHLCFSHLPGGRSGFQSELLQLGRLTETKKHTHQNKPLKDNNRKRNPPNCTFGERNMGHYYHRKPQRLSAWVPYTGQQSRSVKRPQPQGLPGLPPADTTTVLSHLSIAMALAAPLHFFLISGTAMGTTWRGQLGCPSLFGKEEDGGDRVGVDFASRANFLLIINHRPGRLFKKI